MLTPREIIAESWAITTSEKSLRHWGFFGSFFEILLDVKLLIYQIYFAYEYFYGGGEAGLFDIEIYLYHSIPFGIFVALVIAFLLLVVVELIVPNLAIGAIVGLAAKSHKGEPVKGGTILAMYNFFSILVIHEMFIFSSLAMLVTAVSVILRYGSGLQTPLLIICGLLWGISNIIKFFTSFAEPGVVVDKMGPFEALAKSVKLTISYIHHVAFLLLLMSVISIRIFINTLLIVLLPTVIIGIGLLFTYVVTPAVAYTITGIISIGLVMVAAYFFAYMHVFKHTVWTLMFIEMRKEKELDAIG